MVEGGGVLLAFSLYIYKNTVCRRLYHDVGCLLFEAYTIQLPLETNNPQSYTYRGRLGHVLYAVLSYIELLDSVELRFLLQLPFFLVSLQPLSICRFMEHSESSECSIGAR